ncbi:glycogen debranching protein GlgX [Kocuria palustris]|uniref:glycogen debranching protein GlgX n=1 Tax=Kocuria palustris TaxID=71999 RepID=UPI0021B46871|nr:glycogen debranching protein GlgX [Kocuria palustris]
MPPAPGRRPTAPGPARSRPRPLGVSQALGGQDAANIAVWAPGVDRLDLVWQVPGGRWRRHTLRRLEGGIHFDLVPPAPGGGPAMPPGTRYGFVDAGSSLLRDGSTPCSEQILLDPHGRGLEQVHHVPGRRGVTQPDTYGSRYVSVIVDDAFDWAGDLAPDIPWRDTVIYEAHVKGLTIQHPGIPQDMRGTYAGLAHPVMIEHLRSLGITAVELLPVHAHLDEPHLTAAGLSNHWGYNTLSYFAPHAAYATRAAQRRGPQGVLDEFKQMVKDLHAAGLEVILDVVYNHTAEAGRTEQPYCWRGLGDRQWYRHDDSGDYLDVTGCGNTLDFSRPEVVRMALDSLRYWTDVCHIDGFRFDLAPALGRDASHSFTARHPFLVAAVADPSIGGAKLISEPWDVGLGGWQTGRFPPGWADWNDVYRDTVRDFWLTEQRGMADGAPGGGLSRLADVLVGSPGRFAASGRTPLSSVNFVTAHDGFTLHDLTTYDHKHNEANREDNRDGTDDNHSWNHGEEGPSRSAAVRSARARTARNLMATLVLSQGVPMITAGDEMLRTQGGNNNAYCQDGPIGYVSWKTGPAQRAMLETTREALRVRRRFLRRQAEDYMMRPEDIRVLWFAPEGRLMRAEDWEAPGARAVQMLVRARHGGVAGLVMLNGAREDREFTVPHLSEDLFAAEDPGAVGSGAAADHPERAVEFVFSTDAEQRASCGLRLDGGQALELPGLTVAALAFV